MHVHDNVLEIRLYVFYLSQRCDTKATVLYLTGHDYIHS